MPGATHSALTPRPAGPPPPRPAVFLDRDGTIIEEVGYLSDPAGVRLIPGAAEGIRLLNDANVPVVIVTNQAGVGRGYFPESAVAAIHAELERQLARHGARWDAVYYCPHHPDAGCECRKPSPGMLRRAAREHDLDLARSFIVGDKLSDLRAGPPVGCRTVLVMTGYGPRELAKAEAHGFKPDLVTAELTTAAEWILTERGGLAS